MSKTHVVGSEAWAPHQPPGRLNWIGYGGTQHPHFAYEVRVQGDFSASKFQYMLDILLYCCIVVLHLSSTYYYTRIYLGTDCTSVYCHSTPSLLPLSGAN